MSLGLDKSTWQRVTFGDVVRNVNETLKGAAAGAIDRVIAMEHMDPGELKIERWGDIADGTTFTRRVRPRQTLFGKRRAYQRKVAYAEFDAICSGDIYTFEADETRMLGEFLPFLVQSDPFFDHALDTSAGSLSPRTNWRDLADFEFELPPLDEQKRIADLLWSTERALDAQRKLISAAETATAAHLDGLLADKGAIEPLGSLVSAIVDCAHKTAPTDDSAFGRVIGTPDVRNGRIRLASARPVSEATFQEWTERAIPQAGDLIFTREAPSGEVGIVPEGERVCLGQRTVLIRPHNVDDGYLVWAVLRSTSVQELIRLKSAGSTVPHLNVSDIRALPVPWPSDVASREVVRRSVDAGQTLVETLRAADAQLITLRRTMLMSVFGGN